MDHSTPTRSKPMQFAAFVGIDWADQEHAGALSTGKGRVETFEPDQTSEAINQGAANLHQRFRGGRVPGAV